MRVLMSIRSIWVSACRTVSDWHVSGRRIWPMLRCEVPQVRGLLARVQPPFLLLLLEFDERTSLQRVPAVSHQVVPVEGCHHGRPLVTPRGEVLFEVMPLVLG